MKRQWQYITVNKVIVDRIRLAPQFLRANLLLRSIVTIVILALTVITSFAWYKHNESHDRLVAYNLSQGRASLIGGRALQAAPPLMRAFQDGAQSSQPLF